MDMLVKFLAAPLLGLVALLAVFIQCDPRESQYPEDSYQDLGVALTDLYAGYIEPLRDVSISGDWPTGCRYVIADSDNVYCDQLVDRIEQHDETLEDVSRRLRRLLHQRPVGYEYVFAFTEVELALKYLLEADQLLVDGWREQDQGSWDAGGSERGHQLGVIRMITRR